MEKSRSESLAPAKSSRKHKLDDRYAEVEAELITQVRCAHVAAHARTSHALHI